jgi:hypothetical protein
MLFHAISLFMPKGQSNKVASLSGGHDQWLPASEQETADKFTCLKAFSFMMDARDGSRDRLPAGSWPLAAPVA